MVRGSALKILFIKVVEAKVIIADIRVSGFEYKGFSTYAYCRGIRLGILSRVLWSSQWVYLVNVKLPPASLASLRVKGEELN